MTKWEIGQDLIRIADFIGEVRDDFKNNGEDELSTKLKVVQAMVGDIFKVNNDHDFLILESDDLK